MIASLSPLLTCAHLWQRKEWRVDRLREHVRAEGWFRQLFGLSRPAWLGFLGCMGLLGLLTPDQWTFTSLMGLAALTVIQRALHRQPFPVWTKKATALVITTLLLTGGATVALQTLPSPPHLLLPFLPLLQPLLLALSRLLWLPVDTAVKQRVLAQARRLRAQYPDLIVIGITGSVGKTTTKELLAHILRDHCKVIATPSHVNAEVGVAQWFLSLAPAASALRLTGSSVLIVEMGAYRKGELALLCSVVQPTLGILTFVGDQHLALFGSQKTLMETKGELLDALPSSGRAFVNGDSDLCRAVVEQRARGPVTIVGTGGHCDLEAFEIQETSLGIRFRVRDTVFSVPLHGTHNVTNVLLAVAAAEHLGMPLGTIAKELQSFTPLPQTFEVRTEAGVTILDDTHNASPASFNAAIAWARNHPAQQKMLLTSGLIELGEETEHIHTELGARAASVFDEVFFTNRKLAKSFQRGFAKPVSSSSPPPYPLPPGTLLVCIGRMPPDALHRFFPFFPSCHH